MKTIKLDLKNVDINVEQNITKGVLVSKTRNVGNFTVLGDKVYFVLDEKTPYTKSELSTLTNQIKIGNNETVEDLILYLLNLYNFRKLMMKESKNRWKHFYLCCGKIDGKKRVFRFASRTDDKKVIHTYYDEILSKYQIQSEIVRQFDDISEIESYKEFVLA